MSFHLKNCESSLFQTIHMLLLFHYAHVLMDRYGRVIHTYFTSDADIAGTLDKNSF